MKISAPGLNAEMKIESISVKNSVIAIDGKIGPYGAQSALTKSEFWWVALQLLRPSFIWALMKLSFSNSEPE